MIYFYGFCLQCLQLTRLKCHWSVILFRLMFQHGAVMNILCHVWATFSLTPDHQDLGLEQICSRLFFKIHYYMLHQPLVVHSHYSSRSHSRCLDMFQERGAWSCSDLAMRLWCFRATTCPSCISLSLNDSGCALHHMNRNTREVQARAHFWRWFCTTKEKLVEGGRLYIASEQAERWWNC